MPYIRAKQTRAIAQPLPATGLLIDITINAVSASALASIGWHRELPTAPAPQLNLTRIIEQHRSGFVVSDGQRQLSCQAHPKLKQLPAAQRPAVGDFIWLDQQLAMFSQCLPRSSELKRAAAGEKYAEQVLAANVDKVLIVCGLDRDFSARRIERYLTLVHGCQIPVAIVLSKADTHSSADAARAELKLRIGDTKVYALDVRDPLAVRALMPELVPGSTGVLLGSSGAGKSTLSNALMGIERMATGAVRANDGRGRHTTVHRALLQLEWGACLIDSPGLREIKLTGDEEVGAQTFGDISELATQCRFNDCVHAAEPDCAVQRAIEHGALSVDRLHSYNKLSLEADIAKARALGLRGQKGPARNMRR
jgi:ribosome biogenesis GTPase / thiamine phosphate phosphatase